MAQQMLQAPTNLAFDYSQLWQSTTFSWDPVPNAESYKIYRNGVYTDEVSYAEYNSEEGADQPGDTVQYSVQAVADGWLDSPIATKQYIVPMQLDAPEDLVDTQTISSIALSWSAVPNATFYSIVRFEPWPSLQRVTHSQIIGTSFTDTDFEFGKTYVYYVTAHADGYEQSEESEIYVTVKMRSETPSITVNSAAQNAVVLGLSSADAGVIVALSRDGTQISTHNVTSAWETWTYTDSGLSENTTYTYSAYAYTSDSSTYPSEMAYLAARTQPSFIQRQEMYFAALKRPFTKLCRLRFLYPNGATAFALDNNPRNKRSKAFIQDGTVNANMQNGQRLSATVTIANADHMYDFALNNIWFGQQIALDEGLLLPNGEEYWRQTGVFLIDNPQETINPNTRTISYTLVDKWADLDGTLDGNLEGTYEVPVNANIYTPIAALLNEDKGNGNKVDYVSPVFTEYFNSKTQELPDGSTASMVLSPYTLTVDGDGGTIGEVVLGLCGMVNAWVGYDNTGRLRIEPSQDDILDAQKPVLYRFTQDEVTLLGLAYTIKKEDLYNDYIVVGELMDDYAQPGGRAQNLDNRSDTCIQIIGRKTKREIASGFATTQQCMDLAEWRLKRSGVLQKAVNISCSQMFHIELNSLVEIVRTDKPGNPIERHLVQGYSRPLASNGPMTVTAVSTADYPMATVTEWPQ